MCTAVPLDCLMVGCSAAQVSFWPLTAVFKSRISALFCYPADEALQFLMFS